MIALEIFPFTYSICKLQIHRNFSEITEGQIFDWVRSNFLVTSFLIISFLRVTICNRNDIITIQGDHGVQIGSVGRGRKRRFKCQFSEIKSQINKI
jgi:hypothetical protein